MIIPAIGVGAVSDQISHNIEMTKPVVIGCVLIGCVLIGCVDRVSVDRVCVDRVSVC